MILFLNKTPHSDRGDARDAQGAKASAKATIFLRKIRDTIFLRKINPMNFRRKFAPARFSQKI